MCHFLIVNTTQKSVEKSVEQRIYARLTNAIDVDNVPNLPRWIKKTVDKGEDEQALKYIDYLNTEKDSPWKDKINMANDGRANLIKQSTFVQAIKKYVLVANNPTRTKNLIDKQYKIFLNYWISVFNLLGSTVPSVLYKYNGVELFCRFSVPFFNKLDNEGDFQINTMENLLKQTFENVDGDYIGVGHPDFWSSGGKASFLNSGAINVVNSELVKALQNSTSRKGVKI
jgi:hypothetical protein